MRLDAMSDATHLLIVDDDPGIREMLRRYFDMHNFQVNAVADGIGMREELARARVDVMLLDLGLPGEDGLELTRYLHQHWSGPVIIITGRGESVDRVVGLELGADDYVAKPLDLRELLARVRSVVRRYARSSNNQLVADQAPFRFPGFRLDPLTRDLSTAQGEPVALTTREYELLCVFLDCPNRVLSRDDLMDRIHGRASGPFDRAIDVQVGRLRRKIETNPAQPELIKTVRGAGYMFTAHIVRGNP